MFDAAFTQIRQNAAGNLAVTLRLFRAVRHVARHVNDPHDTSHLRHFVDMVHNQAAEAARHEYDQSALERQYQDALNALRRDR